LSNPFGTRFDVGAAQLPVIEELTVGQHPIQSCDDRQPRKLRAGFDPDHIRLRQHKKQPDDRNNSESHFFCKFFLLFFNKFIIIFQQMT